MDKFGKVNHSRTVLTCIILSLVMGLSIVSLPQRGHANKTDGHKAAWRILHIMSYHSPWKWTDDQLNGFKDALKGLDIEYKVFQMDTKRKSTEEWKERIGKKARVLIDSWKPNLVYTNDDNAQKYVAKYFVNDDIPFVFSGVNADPSVYGFVGSKNITGVLEQEHSVQTVKLLKQIVSTVTKIAIISDTGDTWKGVIQRMKQHESKMGVEISTIDIVKTFQQYKDKIRSYKGKVDAVCQLGVFLFKDENDANVPYQAVGRWMVENSQLPDFSYWEDRVEIAGTLCSVTVSGYEQGYTAGKIARGILVEGHNPSSYPMQPTIKGKPVISLARAKKLGLKIKTKTLLTAKVIKEFNWDSLK